MKLSKRLAISILSAAFACASLSPALAADKAPKQTVSRAAAKPLKAAQDALVAKNFTEAVAKLKEVEAMPNKTPYDTHVMNEMFGSAYGGQKNYAEAAKAFEAGLNDGLLE